MSNKHHPPKKLHIKKGDTVKVITGNEKNKTGEVLVVYPTKNRAIVKDINMVIQHLKPSQKNPKGKRQQIEASIHISNLMLVDLPTQTPTRIGRKKNDKGVLQRYAKKSNNLI